MYKYYQVEGKIKHIKLKNSTIKKFKDCDEFLRTCSIESYVLPLSYNKRIYKVENSGECVLTHEATNALDIKDAIESRVDRPISSHEFFFRLWDVRKAVIISVIFKDYFDDYFKVKEVSLVMRRIKRLEKKDWLLVYHPLVEGQETYRVVDFN